MCGILSKIDFKNRNVNADIICNYINQRNRGTKGYGFAYVQDGRVYTRRSTDEHGIMKNLLKCQSSAIMFHHRIPTSTDNVISSCHPFVIDIPDGSVALIHNGVINNDDELFAEHQKAGITYTSYDKKSHKWNDSESLAIDFARYISGQQEEMKATGWVAFIAFRMDENKKLKKVYFIRNSTAVLNFDFTEEYLNIGSEITGKQAEVDTLYEFDYETGKMFKTPLTLHNYYSSGTETQVIVNEPADDTRRILNYYKMTDAQLSQRIADLEDQIQELEAIAYAGDENEARLNNAYRELEFAYDEYYDRAEQWKVYSTSRLL